MTLRCTCNSRNPSNARYCQLCGGELGGDSTHAPAPQLNPGKRRTLYEPPGAGSPAPQQPAASRPAGGPGDFFDTPLPPRGGFNPDDPFQPGNWQPPTKNQVAEAPPPAASAPRRRAGTILERPEAHTAALRGVLLDSKATDREGIHPVRIGRNSLGRDPDADISLDDGKVSTSHGFLFLREEGASFIDTSTNGTIVDGKLAHGTQVDLAHGSVLELGETRLVLLLAPSTN